MKRFAALALMMVVLMFTSIAGAGYTINQFPVYAGAGDQENPDIDIDVNGEIVVWQSGDSIYWKSGDSDPNVIDSGGTQAYPAVSNDVVVWYDAHTFNGTQKDIYGYNMQSQADLFITSNDGKTQKNADISGDTVVYEHLDGVYDVYVYKISLDSSEVIEASSTHQLRPAVDGDLAVWMDGRNDGYAGFDIYMCDLSVKPFVSSSVSASDGDQWDPAISGTVVVWREDIDDDPDTGLNIYGYDLDDLETGRFDICTALGDQQYPAISGSIVAWQDDSDSDIWAIDLADMGSGFFRVSDGTGDNQRPAVSGNTIVWQREQQNWDIYGARLLEPSSVTVTAPNGGERVEAATSTTITWDSTGPVVDVRIEFSSDNGVNWTDVNTVEDTGSYFWDPIADLDSGQCLIAVTNVDDPTATDTSDAVFEIYQIPDSITVSDPNGGEQFLAGSVMDIHWTSVGEINDVKIEFSFNNRIDWDEVVASTPNIGAFRWDSESVTADVDSTQCSIRISAVLDFDTRDVSNEVFTVFQCDVELTADLTGDCFVGLADFAMFAAQWLDCGNPHDPAWCGE